MALHEFVNVYPIFMF